MFVENNGEKKVGQQLIASKYTFICQDHVYATNNITELRRYVTLDYQIRNKLYYNLLISLKCLKILISGNDRMLFYSGQVYKSILQVYCYARLHYFVNFPTQQCIYFYHLGYLIRCGIYMIFVFFIHVETFKDICNYQLLGNQNF